ncbi:rhomboid family intramembrane serine protease [Sphingomonas changnyeongensis]|uniref:Rhomboid family intramembrane serine protease n=1 Tax=Sphingomonas changnyeongensis TaxID=2698679 RepID=A0A7Z2NXF7_9SPHN|nr:rhomboid family intramembrane serine protease [Sphingomonas changnyeongensis]QHL91024.1 rhomboid family intramembrane serine protease [Sphingomonas changnyeongensis]
MPDAANARVTNWIAVFTALAWMLVALMGDGDRFAVAAGFIPLRLTEGLDLPGAWPVWTTPLSATLIHAGLVHLAFNLLMFVYCGRFVEQVIGGAGSAVLYVAGAYGAAAAHWAVDPGSTVPMIGASGAMSATIGAYAVFFSRAKVRAIGPLSPFVVRVLWLAAAWIFVQSLLGLSAAGGRIAIAAHIGGFITGLALARPLLMWRYRNA